MWAWVESPQSGQGHPQRPDGEGYWEGQEWEIVGSAGPRVRKLKFKSQDLWITKSLDCSDDNSDCHSLLCVRECAEPISFPLTVTL